MFWKIQFVNFDEPDQFSKYEFYRLLQDTRGIEDGNR